MGYKKIVYVFIVLVAFLFVTFFVRDWVVFYQCGAVESCLKDSSGYQHIAKFLVPVIAGVITLFIGKDAVCKRDRLLLQISFFLIICADSCFKIFHNYFISFEENNGEYIGIGIIFFMLAQTVLIYRHTRLSDTDRSIPWVFCVPLAITFSLIWLLVFGILESVLFFAVAAYGPYLFCSLYVACRVPKLGYFPKENARKIKLGMICFTCCDLLTGLSLWTGADHSMHEVVATVSNNFIWCFYTPTLILLALSGYRHED